VSTSILVDVHYAGDGGEGIKRKATLELRLLDDLRRDAVNSVAGYFTIRIIL